jgi:CheY-like chemotaxis protein
VHDQTPEFIDAIHTVLYIEDNVAHIGLIERVFARRPNLELISTTEGLLGLEVARDQQPAVVLLDMRLPDIDGDEVLQRLREIREPARFPSSSSAATPSTVTSNDGSKRVPRRISPNPSTPAYSWKSSTN